MTIFYTSDTHFGHANIIKYAGRPFSSSEEMDEVLIKRWNEVVKPTDHIWHLGDVTMERNGNQRESFVRLIKRLHGHKRLILGNHDHFPVEVYLDAGFEKIQACHRHEGLFLSHVPIHPSSMGRHLANVHGHIHDQPAFPRVKRINYTQLWEGKEPIIEGNSPYINICVEQTHYRPISLEEVQDLVRKAS